MLLRSPVFKAMLQADMLEKNTKRIPVIDAKVEDVRQLLAYIYTAKVSPEYIRFKELSALGDRYNVQSLVDFCATKLEASLTVENVLDVGIFAETHNSDLLMDKCAEFIANKRKISIDDDWMKKTEKSPMFATKIIKKLLDSSCSGPIFIHIANYAGAFNRGVSTVSAIKFTVDSKVSLLGFGIFGAQDTNQRSVTINVFHNDTRVLAEKQSFNSIGSYNSYDQINLSSPVQIEANQQYEITVVFNGTANGYGQRISIVIKSTGPDPITVTISPSPKDAWGDRYNIFHSLCFTKSDN